VPPDIAATRYDLDALEFAAVRALLVERLRTPLGRSAAAALAPLPSAAAVARELATVAAVARGLLAAAEPPLQGAVEVRSWLGPCFAGEHQLQARDLADLKRSLRAAERCRLWLRARGEGVLEQLAAEAPDLSNLVEELALIVDDRGEILGSASARLQSVRAEIEAARQAVDAAVMRVTNEGDLRRFLQSPEVSWRHGRPMLQVKQEYRARVPGVLHDRSQSGSTLFIEPEAVVEVSNRLSDAQAAEHREIQVVLANTARGLSRARAEVERAIAFLARADLLVAKASLVAEAGFVVPEVSPDGPLRLRSARHPLLLQSRLQQPVVPLDVTLGEPNRVLVVTGPNTGGKTVVLKTIGLLSLMALAGVPIPAEAGTRVPFFAAVLADIGDEQGISQNLSTFSSHVVRIVRCLQAASGHSLVLLDELGAGTDPEEGGVLGYAVLEELLMRGSFAVVTTHLGRLKDFAYQNTGAVNGSMAFDGKTLQPLYRLEVGIPGSSHALDIAGRVGMPDGVVRRARELLGRVDLRLQDVIDKVQVARQSAEADRRETQALAQKAAADSRRLEAELQETQRKANWLHEEADAIVDQQVRALRTAMAEHLQALQSAPGQHGERARELKRAVDSMLGQVSAHRRRMQFCFGLKKGDRVFLPRLQRASAVHKVDKVRETVTVDYGNMRIEVPFEDVSWLQPLDGGPA
jgi:DNA mismatch repair protein MutS2